MSWSPELPKVSIVIPAYNSGAVVLESVRSALGQSYPNCEVLVIDDGSTDDTREKLTPLGSSIRYYWQENGGLARARNAGHRLADGEYIAWLDADDIAHPDRVAWQAHFLMRNPHVAVVAAEFTAFDSAGRLFPEFSRTYYGRTESLETLFGRREEFEWNGQQATIYSGDVSRRLLLGNFLHPPTVMIRRSAVQRAGELEGDVPVSEDWCYLMRLSRLGAAAFVAKTLLHYRLSDTQMSSPKNNPQRVAQGRLKAVEKLSREHADLARLQAAELNRLRARIHLDAADAFCEDDRRAAMSHLWASLRLGHLSASQCRTLVKLLAPRFVIEAYRRRKGEH